MPEPASARYVLLAAAPERRHGGDDGDDEECYYTASARYAPLRRDHGEYAARRALFLQSYRFTTAATTLSRDDDGERDGGGLRGRVARRVRDAVARAASRARGAARWWIGARAWPRLGSWTWRPPRARLGCFGHGHGRKVHYLQHFA